MPGWAGSDRKARLPANWIAIRAEVFRQKGTRCVRMIGPTQCPNEATDIDHIVPSGPATVENLQPLCRRCHRRKSSSEGWEALRRKRRQARNRVDKQFGWAEKRPEPETPFKHPWMR